MVRPTILPPPSELGALRAGHRRDKDHPGGCESGHTLRQIADMYGVTSNGVYVALRKAGLTSIQPRYSDTLPWVVASEHEQSWEATMLRELSKRSAGHPAGNKGQYLDAWLRELDHHPQHVIAYEREKGFYRVKRRASDGDGYIRRPTKKALREAREALIHSRGAPG